MSLSKKEFDKQEHERKLTLMNMTVVGLSEIERELWNEFTSLKNQVAHGLRTGTVPERPRAVYSYKGTVKRFRGWRRQSVPIIGLTRATKWTSFGVLHKRGADWDPDEYDIYFISDLGTVGGFIGYIREGCYIDEYDSPWSEAALRKWVTGLRTILGFHPEYEGEPEYFVNPA